MCVCRITQISFDLLRVYVRACQDTSRVCVCDIYVYVEPRVTSAESNSVKGFFFVHMFVCRQSALCIV